MTIFQARSRKLDRELRILEWIQPERGNLILWFAFGIASSRLVVTFRKSY